MERGPSKIPLAVGVALVACGWAAIYLGWRGASEHKLEVGQLPYLISGGFGGLGLIVLGSTALLVYWLMRAEWLRRISSAEMTAALQRVGESLENRPLPDETPDLEEAPRLRRRARLGRSGLGRRG